jgi:hypothetical protein
MKKFTEQSAKSVPYGTPCQMHRPHSQWIREEYNVGKNGGKRPKRKATEKIHGVNKD